MLVPKLRFEEFKYEWSYYTFKELISLKSNTYNPQKDRKEYNCIELEHINQENGTINGYTGSRGQKSCKNFFKKGSILFGKLRPYLKKYWLASFSGVCSSEIWVLNSKNTQVINNGFIFYIIQSHYFIELCKLSTGSKMPRADWSYIKEQSVAIPGVEEQKKISKLLLLLDKKIELQQRKIEALKIYKRGLIQRIYQKNYNNKIKMEKILIQKYIRNTNDENYNVYSVSNKDGFILQTEQFKDRIVASEDTKNYKVVETDDFAYNPARINVGSIARMKKDTKGIISPMYICFKCNEEILPEYLEYFFESSKFTYEMNKRLEGSVRMCLSYESMLNIPIELPNKNEQEEISKILNNLSDKIKLEEEKWIKLKKLKRGLLQKMFI